MNKTTTLFAWAGTRQSFDCEFFGTRASALQAAAKKVDRPRIVLFCDELAPIHRSDLLHDVLAAAVAWVAKAPHIHNFFFVYGAKAAGAPKTEGSDHSGQWIKSWPECGKKYG
eukprot:388553_1